jgi:hypothetical protein
MQIGFKDSIDPTIEYQLINCGGGLLETYSLGTKTGAYPIGEIAMRSIEGKIEFLSDDRAQQLVQSYCDNVIRIRTEPMRQVLDRQRFFVKFRGAARRWQ